MKKKLLFLLALILNFAANAQTATIYRSGTPLSPTYTTLKAALANVINGDEIRLSAHTFYEYNDTIAKIVRITGTISGTDTTTIDAKGMGAVIYNLASSITDSTVLKDLIITGGYNPSLSGGTLNGGGIASYANLSLAGNVIVRNNISDGDGGGISNDGTLYIMGGEGSGASAIKIYNNTSTSPTGSGGGIHTSQCHLYVSGNVEISNNSAYTGAGVFVWRTSYNKVSFNSKSGSIQIKNNKSDQNGAGITLTGPVLAIGNRGSGVQLSGNIVISGNTAKGKGGGIYDNDSTVYNGPGIQIINNSADAGGGGICTGTKPNGGYTVLNNVTISGNTTKAKGAGIYIENYHDVKINGGQIINNQADAGAAAIHNLYVASVNNCRIFNPTSAGKRQLEVQNNQNFSSSQCWWGESDTTGLIVHNPVFPSASFNLTNWVVANWSINNGSPVGAASSYPIEAFMKLNTGVALPAASFSMLQGKYFAPTGSFSPTTASISAANKIISTYTRPASGTSTLWAVVDADSFKSNSNGLSVQSIGNAKMAIKAYPNPSKNVVKFDGLNQSVAAIVYDLQGRIVSTSTIDQNNNQIDLGSAANGTYILQLKAENEIVQQFKIVKE